MPAANGQASEKVSDAPGVDSQVRPRRPRPAVCRSATRARGASTLSAGASRAQASRSALVEAVSSTRSISTAAGLRRVHFPFGASMVPRHLRLPQWQANCFFAFFVCRPSSTRP